MHPVLQRLGMSRRPSHISGHIRSPDLPETLDPYTPSADETVPEFFERVLTNGVLASPRGEAYALRHCRVSASRLGQARLELLADTELDRCDFSNADWSDARLQRVVFRDCRGTGLGLGSATLTDAVFTDCKLNLACLMDAKLHRVRFERCDLREADFDTAQLHSVMFRDCELSGARLVRSPLAGVDLRGSRLGQIVFSAEHVHGCLIDPSQAETFAAALGLRIALPDENADT